MSRQGVRARVVAAGAGRDRVSDAVKALALALVILGHALAWTRLPDGSVTNTLEVAPNLYPLTWVLQILPLFFVLAGSGLTRLATRTDAGATFARVERLASPAAFLLVLTLALVVVLTPTGSSTVTEAVGIIPVQLVWFLGVYLLVVAAAPVLARVTHPAAVVGWLAAIGLVDLLRVRVDPTIGWLNLFLVWAWFAILGLSLPRLRRLPRIVLVGAFLVSVAGALTLVAVGPYSAALISTDAVPGISNLAPPTLVLAAAGVAQLSLLLLVWPALDGLLARPAVWVPVAVFATRAMALYLYQMVFLALGIGAVLVVGGTPVPLGPAWWVQHAVVAVVAVGAVWLLAPALIAASSAIVAAIARPLAGPGARVGAGPRWVARCCATVVGLVLLEISESGLGDPLVVRPVLGLPYQPLAAVIVVLVLTALAVAARAPAVVTS